MTLPFDFGFRKATWTDAGRTADGLYPYTLYLTDETITV